MSGKLEISEWTGCNRLKHGEFVEFAEAVCAVYRGAGFETIGLGAIGPELEGAVAALKGAMARERAFDETTTIARADAERVALFKAAWRFWRAMLALGAGHAMGRAANTLRSELSAHGTLWRRSLAERTATLDAVAATLATDANRAALAALGLDRAFEAIGEANGALKEAFAAREEVRSERAEERASGSVRELRRTAAGRLAEAARMVNALRLVAPTEALAGVVRRVCGIVEEFRRVASRPSHRREGSGGGDAAKKEEMRD